MSAKTIESAIELFELGEKFGVDGITVNPDTARVILGALHAQQERENMPEVICLCGSTRFYDEFQKANYNLTMRGKVVLTVGFYPHSVERAHGENVGCTEKQKRALDELHKRKIDLADRVLVLNVGGYIGESTRSEIEYAEAHGKPVDYLEPKEVEA